MESQTMKHSHSILAQLVLPMQANPAGNVHGGEIMKMMDSAAGVAAQKHAHTNVVTARVDELNFKKPVLVGELVTCKAQVIYAGRSSMEVFVTVESEDLITGNKQIALTAFFTMVSTSSGRSGSKNTSAHRERIAGLISCGSRVVAPMRMKSAGAPSRNNFLIYAGT